MSIMSARVSSSYLPSVVVKRWETGYEENENTPWLISRTGKSCWLVISLSLIATPVLEDVSSPKPSVEGDLGVVLNIWAADSPASSCKLLTFSSFSDVEVCWLAERDGFQSKASGWTVEEYRSDMCLSFCNRGRLVVRPSLDRGRVDWESSTPLETKKLTLRLWRSRYIVKILCLYLCNSMVKLLLRLPIPGNWEGDGLYLSEPSFVLVANKQESPITVCIYPSFVILSFLRPFH